MLAQRLITAALGIPLIAGVILLGGPVYDIVVAIILAVAAFEFCAIVSPPDGPSRPFWKPTLWQLLAVAGIILVVVRANRVDDEIGVVCGIIALWLVSTMIRNRPLSYRRFAWMGALVAVVYIGVLGAHLVPLRDLDGDGKWVFLAILGTWATDTFAYGIGRLIGRRKITPRISPGKTLEGTAAGLAGGLASVIVIAEVLDLPMSIGEAALLGALLPAAAVLGDLVESHIKRGAGVKDTSELVPGHGGFLDRLDSLLFTVPLVYYFAIWVVL